MRPRIEIALPQSTLNTATSALMVRVENINGRATNAAGDQYTLAELLGGEVELFIVNETITKERTDARHGQDSHDLSP